MKRTVIGLFLLLLTSLVVQADEKRSAFDNAVEMARIHGFTEILRNSGIPIETLRNGDYTLLIPVDVSFYKLTPQQYQRLLSPEEKKLAEDYVHAHMVAGRLTLEQLAAGSYQSLAGTPIKVTIGAAGAPATVNGHKVFQGEITGTKGIVHLIEGFLLEP